MFASLSLGECRRLAGARDAAEFLLLATLSLGECRRLAGARDADQTPPRVVNNTAPQVSVRRQRPPPSGDVSRSRLGHWRSVTSVSEGMAAESAMVRFEARSGAGTHRCAKGPIVTPAALASGSLPLDRSRAGAPRPLVLGRRHVA
ncbi:MAG: hypothetical protein AB7W59_11835 [Acidimicrobiia bacterium]